MASLTIFSLILLLSTPTPVVEGGLCSLVLAIAVTKAGRIIGHSTESKPEPQREGRGCGGCVEVMTLSIDPNLHNFHGFTGALLPTCWSTLDQKSITQPMFIQAQEETELNVKKQSGAAVGADSSWFPGVRQVGWPWRIQPMAGDLAPWIDSFRLICQHTGQGRIFKHWHKCRHGQRDSKWLESLGKRTANQQQNDNKVRSEAILHDS